MTVHIPRLVWFFYDKRLLDVGFYSTMKIVHAPLLCVCVCACVCVGVGVGARGDRCFFYHISHTLNVRFLSRIIVNLGVTLIFM